MTTEIILINRYPLQCLAPLKPLEDKHFDIRKIVRFATIYLLYDYSEKRLRVALHNVLRAEPSYFFTKAACRLIGDVDAGHELNTHFKKIFESADYLLEKIFKQTDSMYRQGIRTTQISFVNQNSKALWLSIIDNDL